MKEFIFKQIVKFGCEEVRLCHDKSIGLRAVIAIHDTTLGPAGGGTRRWVYNSEQEAVEDAIRLARAMTYKYAAAGINCGGGKGVIIVNSMDEKSEELYRAYGRFVDSFNGRFYTGGDVGTGIRELRFIKMETDYVLGLPETWGEGRPEGYMPTSWGVIRGMKACCEEVFGDPSLESRTVVVQGLGKVGEPLVKYLLEEGAKVTVTDINIEQLKKTKDEYGGKVKAVDPDKIYNVDCDIFSPCALGGILNDDTIPQLKCKIVAGGANNQLKEDRYGDILHKKGILYAPDYVINAGTAIDDIYTTMKGGYNYKAAREAVDQIYDRIKSIIEISKRDNIPTYKAADKFAEERIKKIGGIKNLRVKEVVKPYLFR
jgi:leucine dehydrogenase